ncbi:MAG: aldolase/citrate lyase family protein [Bdellovibrionales bacterium]|nr:aldolase/citrate lyase family protein [Bdellovibrionales bacterium]
MKQTLKNHQLSIGAWITLAHGAMAEIFCRNAFEWVCVDLEHSSITLSQAESLIRIIDLHKKFSFVRPSSIDHDQIKRVLDSGAHGIIAPRVNNKEDVEKCIDAIYYPPVGKRGVGLARAQGYGDKFEKYRDEELKEKVLIVQIEHIDAVNNIDEIFNNPLVDGYFIGPFDLSASMGRAGNFNHPEIKEALEKVKLAAIKYNIPGGIHVVEADPIDLQSKIDFGYKFIAYSSDVRILDKHCKFGDIL